MQGSTIFKRFIYANGKGKKIDALNDVAVSKDDSGDEKKLWNSKWLENQTGFYAHCQIRPTFLKIVWTFFEDYLTKNKDYLTKRWESSAAKYNVQLLIIEMA